MQGVRGRHKPAVKRLILLAVLAVLDGLTTLFMMHVDGVGIEANPVMKSLYGYDFLLGEVTRLSIWSIALSMFWMGRNDSWQPKVVTAALVLFGTIVAWNMLNVLAVLWYLL